MVIKKPQMKSTSRNSPTSINNHNPESHVIDISRNRIENKIQI